MSYNKAFEAKELPLMLKYGVDLVNYTLTITTNAGANYDYSGITDINLYIYDHPGGTLLVTLVMTTNITVTSNVVTINADYSTEINLDRSDIRYYELDWEDSLNRPLGISYGDLKII